jgi:hypothetical protein
LAGYSFVVPNSHDPDQEARDHGNLMDEGVAEVEREAAEAAGGQDHGPEGQAADSLSPTDRSTAAAAFSEDQVAEEDSERQKARNGPSKPPAAHRGSDEQAAELRAEQIAEANDSVT